MSELKIQLSGWQAIVGIIILIGVIAVRFVSINDMRDDDDLMQRVNELLMDEYAPHVAGKMRDAYDSGNKDRIATSVKSVTTTKVNIAAVKASYPIFKFSTPKEVVIKVVFSLDSATESGEERTIYYLFKHGVFGWQYQYITTSFSYYLNFM
ncbi:MAG: hypothetical protein PVI97_02485 [Candidatus Thiodiazotropha sp.]